VSWLGWSVEVYDLMFRRDWPYFMAFDVLSIDGEDLTGRPLIARKRRLKAIMPRIESRLLYLDHVKDRGAALFDSVCARDCEGIVAKWKRGAYHTDGQTTSWLKVKNPSYSQIAGRREVFETRRRAEGTRARTTGPVLCPALAAVSAVVNARL
jgi:ATP-dependent DNA ligase